MPHALKIEVGDVFRVCSESGRFAGLVGQVTALSEGPLHRCRMQFFRHRAQPWIFCKHLDSVSDLEALAFLVQLKE